MTPPTTSEQPGKDSKANAVVKVLVDTPVRVHREELLYCRPDSNADVYLSGLLASLQKLVADPCYEVACGKFARIAKQDGIMQDNVPPYSASMSFELATELTICVEGVDEQQVGCLDVVGQAGLLKETCVDAIR
eukprot:TRINITY_DN60862_c0_g1_i1.p3 TRINITY_DN60862_c0_g1~~TRINITY_DN60862_c0_g1_i1.p3  ORF type:complete len:134 (+),score=16.97 TRINITY_DN60862_c0_g1_i1:397-798(+)